MQFEQSTRTDRDNALRALHHSGELYALGALLFFYEVVFLSQEEALHYMANRVGPLILTAVLGASCFRMIRISSITIWAPLFWFRLSCAVYFGIGAVVPHLISEDSIAYIRSIYNFDEKTNLKVNLITCVGVFAVLILSSLSIVLSLNARSTAQSEGRKEGRALGLYALGFLLVGGVVRYGIVIPYVFGLTEVVIPGVFGAVSILFYVGIFMLVLHTVRSNPALLPLTVALIVIETAVSIASFSKTDLLMLLIFSFLGLVSGKVNRSRIIAGAIFISAAYFVFQPLVTYGRQQIELRYGSAAGADIPERFDIVLSYFRSYSSTDVLYEGGLSRLSYLNVNSMVVDRYDAGRPGSTFEDSLAVFVPRILWRDKPVITELGRDLYFEVRGRYGSALGIGHFAEAYWNFGWVGILPFMCALSLILTMFTWISINIVAAEEWLFFPVVFLGVNVGLRVDGHFVPDVLGACWIALWIGVGLYLAKQVLLGRSRYITAA